MNNKRSLIFPLIFFIIVNTSYFWENLPGFWDFGILIVLLLIYILLFCINIFYLVYLIRNRFKDRTRLLYVIILTIILLITAIYPHGIDFERLQGKDILIAQAEGAANCTSTLKIKKNNRFIETIVCFGISRYKGYYSISGDTVKLEFDNLSNFDTKNAYGIINLSTDSNSNRIGDFLYYHDLKDTIPSSWPIVKYEMKQNKTCP